jgi:DNA gyrase subunit B
MMAKYVQIKEDLEPPFVIEFAPKVATVSAATDVSVESDDNEEAEGEEASDSAEVKVEAKPARRTARVLRDPVEKNTARELFSYIVEQGKKDYQVQRYKGLGEMTSSQLWETTMDPERRTLLQVKLEDLTETDAIFTVLMGEDVESRRKFIEDNALEVKNLDI